MNQVRPTAVAGMFYPDSSEQIQQMFAGWMQSHEEVRIPRAIIVPHAGYIYSGSGAAKGFELWQGAANTIKTVVVFGPAHRVGFKGIATVSFDEVATPLGNLTLDIELKQSVMARFPQVGISDYANAPEHSLEVHFPFIKSVLSDVKILPLLVGQVSAEQVAEVMAYLWQQPDVFFVISSDLSHFHSYDQAQQIDSKTAELINQGDWLALSGERACGYKAIQGMLSLQSPLGFEVKQLVLMNSGDTAGDKQRVVGYGTWGIYDTDTKKER